MTNHPNRSGKRYDLIFCGEGTLLATVPHTGDDDVIEAAVLDECRRAGLDRDELDVWVEDGLHLTDEPRETDEIVYQGPDHGWITDERGIDFKYAVRR